MELDRYDQAQADFIQAIALNDKMDVYYYNLGLIQYTQGEYEDALKNYNKAIELKRTPYIIPAERNCMTIRSPTPKPLPIMTGLSS